MTRGKDCRHSFRRTWRSHVKPKPLGWRACWSLRSFGLAFHPRTVQADMPASLGCMWVSSQDRLLTPVLHSPHRECRETASPHQAREEAQYPCTDTERAELRAKISGWLSLPGCKSREGPFRQATRGRPYGPWLGTGHLPCQQS